jgi:hypothetical protein
LTLKLPHFLPCVFFPAWMFCIFSSLLYSSVAATISFIASFLCDRQVTAFMLFHFGKRFSVV